MHELIYPTLFYLYILLFNSGLRLRFEYWVQFHVSVHETSFGCVCLQTTANLQLYSHRK